MSTPEKEPISDWTEDGSIIAAVTQAMREADPLFKKTGGGTRHYVRELLLPIMQKAGLVIAYADKLSQPSPGLSENELHLRNIIERADRYLREMNDDNVHDPSVGLYSDRHLVQLIDDIGALAPITEETPSVQPIEGEQKATDPWFTLKYVKTVLERGFPMEEIIDLIGKKLNEHSSATQSAPEAQPIAAHIHVQLESGAVATVSPDASTELLSALNTMSELAMQMPIADKEVSEDGEPPKELKDYLEAKMRPYHNRISFIAGALECYHKMQEEINDILIVHKSISDSYNELLPESIKTNANLTDARAIQIAGLLASNKEWGEKYAAMEKEGMEYRNMLQIFSDARDESTVRRSWIEIDELLAKYSSPTTTR